jgi:hypothetical protein
VAAFVGSTYGQSREIFPTVFLPGQRIVFSSIGAAYSVAATAFPKTIDILLLINTTNQDIDVSMDGINLFTTVLARTEYTLNFKSNRKAMPPSYSVYVKFDTIAPTSGYFVVTAVGID